MAPGSALNPHQLEQAFQVFNSASSELCVAYEELRQQALVLTHQLAVERLGISERALRYKLQQYRLEGGCA